ncbi:AAA domain-containing protein [Fibrobacter sp. UWT3]|uniref:AAA family ATPase n=1 Tax=Fibrobacter sp. UWT3 TaxID=1896225 RepID=UPI000BD5FF27|nr:AAA family ATPase [Fibrobacter sp. UWT3]SOE79129.1 AAA domain-containing protein [Fibrobacter sp. UWT3]
MESARKIINTFLKTKYSPNELKGELFKVGEAAKEEGWTFMDASFQLGGKARDEGLSPDEVEQILRRAFSSEKRSSEREEAQPAAQAAPAAAAQAEPAAMAAPVKPAIISPLSTGMISMEQMLALGLDTQSMELLQNFKIDPEALSIPWPAADWRKDLAKLLDIAFETDETIEFKISDTPNATSELVSNIVGRDDAIKKIMKSLDSQEGALICVNATKGGADAGDESWRYRYAVIDNPKMSLAKQLAYYKALNLPCAALVNTGANSVQAWIKIGANDREEYDERIDFLFKTLDSQGFKVDFSNRSPTMMARMPGVLRGGKQQYLIGTEQGAKNFKEWKEWVEYSLDGKPLIELASDSEEPPKKDASIIENMLRAGEFFLFQAPPKSGKSLALMDMALSICYGEDWFGNSTSSNDVLFINFELTKSVFLNRLHLLGNKRGLNASTPKFGFLNLRGTALSPLETAQLIAKRIEGAKKLENHDYRVVVIDPISAVLHNPKSMRLTGSPHQILMQMVDTIIALTGCAVVTACNNDEYPYLESRADSVISLSPVEGGLNLFQINGSFREFPKMLARECSWIYPRFLV